MMGRSNHQSPLYSITYLTAVGCITTSIPYLGFLIVFLYIAKVVDVYETDGIEEGHNKIT